MNALKKWSILFLLIGGLSNVDAAQIHDQELLDQLLIYKTKERNRDAVTQLLMSGARVNAQNDHGETPLIVAAADPWNFDILKDLLEARADVGIMNREGETALNRAAFRGSPEIIKELLAAGSDINNKGHDGYSVLMAMCLNYYYEHKAMTAIIKKWSINNQIPINDPKDKKILSGIFGNFQRDFDAYPVKLKKAIKDSSLKVIDNPDLMAIIEEYLNIAQTSLSVTKEGLTKKFSTMHRSLKNLGRHEK